MRGMGHGEPEIAPEHHSLDEVRARVASLSPEARYRLIRLARIWKWALPDQQEDVLQEALRRIYAGQRAWPVGVGTIPFIYEVMRSVASQWIDPIRQRRDPLFRAVPIAAGADDAEDGTNEALQVPGAAPTPEQQASVRDLLKKAEAAVEDNETALEVVLRLAEGQKAAEIRSELGLDDVAYETVRKFIRRRLESLND